MNMKLPILFVIIIVVSVVGVAQPSKSGADLTHDAGVKPHSGIDAIYARFSEGYRQLDAKMVADLYTDNAIYMTPESGVDRGRELIVKNFDGFFRSVRGEGASLRISFQIVERKVSGDLAYDVGIYTLETSSGDKVLQTSKGKFVVVAVKQKGKWRFQLDSYSNLPNSTEK
jgi:uncharacterized protein (TIGR02246 family)